MKKRKIKKPTKANTIFKVKLPTQRQIDEIIKMLLGRNPRLLTVGDESYIGPRDLARVVTTMYIARFIQ